MNDLITVIVPIYKVENYISKCIESIINQTYSDIEIILVDDGSPDNCPKICDDYCRRDKRIKVIHKENGGLSDARNIGLECAKGKYILFIDGDDYIKSEMLEIMHKVIISDASDMVICNYELVDEYEKVAAQERDKIYEHDNEKIVIDEKTFWDNCYDYDYLYYVVAWNKLYDRKVFDNIRYKKGAVHEDEIILHKIVDKCNKISCIPEKLYIYVQHENSIMNSKVSEKNMYCIDGIIYRIKYLHKKGFDNHLDRHFNICVSILEKYGMHNGVNDKTYKEYLMKTKRLSKEIFKYKNIRRIIKLKIILFYIGGIKMYRFCMNCYSKMLGQKRGI